MVTKNCVKISYKGLTHQIVCNEKFLYDNLLETVMDKFNIENSLKLAIEFYDEQGHKFNKEAFEYLMLLFPHPQKIFFIRLDCTKIPSKPADTVALIQEDESSYITSRKQTASAKVELETYCEAVPVRRQNCFLGEMPGSTSNQSSLSSNGAQTNEVASEIIKIMKSQSPPKKKHLSNPSHTINRSLRV